MFYKLSFKNVFLDEPLKMLLYSESALKNNCRMCGAELSTLSTRHEYHQCNGFSLMMISLYFRSEIFVYHFYKSKIQGMADIWYLDVDIFIRKFLKMNEIPISFCYFSKIDNRTTYVYKSDKKYHSQCS